MKVSVTEYSCSFYIALCKEARQQATIIGLPEPASAFRNDVLNLATSVLYSPSSVK